MNQNTTQIKQIEKELKQLSRSLSAALRQRNYTRNLEDKNTKTFWRVENVETKLTESGNVSYKVTLEDGCGNIEVGMGDTAIKAYDWARKGIYLENS